MVKDARFWEVASDMGLLTETLASPLRTEEMADADAWTEFETLAEGIAAELDRGWLSAEALTEGAEEAEASDSATISLSSDVDGVDSETNLPKPHGIFSPMHVTYHEKVSGNAFCQTIKIFTTRLAWVFGSLLLSILTDNGKASRPRKFSILYKKKPKRVSSMDGFLQNETKNLRKDSDHLPLVNIKK